MFFISLSMASHQMIFTFSSSNSFASCAALGILTPTLCLQTQYYDFNCTMMRLRFASTCRTHHANAGSPTIHLFTTYLSICTGYELFISLRFTHVFLPSFHCKRTSTPFVVSLQLFVPVRVVMNEYRSFTYVPSHL